MAQTGGPINGRLCKLYLDVDGSIASPTWVELGKVQGAAKTSQRDLAEVKERVFDETTVLLGHNTKEFTVQLTRRPADTNYDTIEDAHESGAKVGIALMTGTITEVGQRGFQGEVYITGFDDDQSHDSTTVNVTFRPAADYTTAPAIVEISA